MWKKGGRRNNIGSCGFFITVTHRSAGGGKRERDVWKRGMYRRRRAVVTSATASVLLQWRFLCQKGIASFFLLLRRYPRKKSGKRT